MSSNGPSTPPTPQVKALLDEIGIEERLHRPRERVMQWVAAVDAKLRGPTDAEEILAHVVDNGARSTVFYLEGILKLYRKKPYPELAGAFAEVKELEDVLGGLDGATAALDLATSHELPERIVAHFKKKKATSTARAREVLAAGWVGGDAPAPVLVDLVRTLAGLEWDDYDDDREHVRERIEDAIQDLRKAPLDMAELQGDFGVHELRRQLRWISIYARALEGAVVHARVKKPHPFYEKMLSSEVAASPFAVLPPPDRERDPVVIPSELHFANTDYVGRLGEIKDRGEEVEGIAHALLELGDAEELEDAEHQALELLGYPHDAVEMVHADAAAIWDEIQREDFLKALRKPFKR